jgi:hypothetical protein
MTVLAITIALVALLGSIFIWLRLKKVKSAVAHLEQLHASSTARVELRELPSFAGPPSVVSPETSPGLIIRGFRNEIILLDNQSNGDNRAIKNLTIDIPTGTTHVIPLLSGFILLYGEIISFIEKVDFSFGIEDHNLGLEWVNIRVVELRTASVTVQAQMWLRDDNGDDEWAGAVHVHILFLGPHP